VHPTAYECSTPYLQQFDEINVKESPVLLEEVETPEYQHLIKHGSGCWAGARQFLKLYAYTMTQHGAVVYFDSDVLMLQPMDHLFDRMLSPQKNNDSTTTISVTHARAAPTIVAQKNQRRHDKRLHSGQSLHAQ
jgi:alpha-N-acetylglucosamine transferase